MEALVGVSEEPGFGPMVTVGPGGTLVELLDDIAVRISPLSAADARDAIKETVLGELLAGYRGVDSGDSAGLASLVRRVGRLATEVDAVTEVDLNPVHVDDGGALALDVLSELTE